MKLIITNIEGGSYQVLLTISCSDSEYDIVIPLIQMFLYDYLGFLTNIRKNSNKNFFQIHLPNSETNGLNFVIRQGRLYLEERRKELLIGHIETLTEESIQDLRNFLSAFPWRYYSMDKEQEMSDLNEMMRVVE